MRAWSSGCKPWLSLILAASCAAGCSNGTSTTPLGAAPSPPEPNGVIPCAQLITLRQLHNRLTVFKNPSTGDSVEYFVIGDGAVGNDLLLMSPGTAQTLAGWPVQLITNKEYSPNIVGTLGFKSSENGTVSLCHNYRMLFFDYPGVGETPYRANLTRDAVASDIDAVLANAHATLGVDTSRVDPLGWSLGTTMAMKYAFLSPVARPSVAIHNIVLIATGPGGSLQGQETHDSASCVKTLFNDSLNYSGSIGKEIKEKLSGLIFPYYGQTATESGTRSDCTASVDASSVTISVKLDCTIFNNCKPYFNSVLLDNKTYPWIRTNGIGNKVYAEERALASDWYVNYCAHAGPNFTSLDCSSYGPVEISKTNGGICKTDTSNPDLPIASDCDRIHLTGKITVIVGFEDL